MGTRPELAHAIQERFAGRKVHKVYEPRYSLILAEPETGRFHQVRRHLSHIAHPLIGDSDHGRPDHNRLLRDRVGLGRLAPRCSSARRSWRLLRRRSEPSASR